MEKVVWAGFVLSIIVMIFYFGIKILDTLIKNRPTYRKQLFVRDLYKLQQKCASAGLYEEAEGVQVLIKGYTLAPEEQDPTTFYGQQIKKALTENE